MKNNIEIASNLLSDTSVFLQGNNVTVKTDGTDRLRRKVISLMIVMDIFGGVIEGHHSLELNGYFMRFESCR